MPKLVAIWNRARGVWETTSVALCGHSEPYWATWPTSGMTRSGSAFELPTLVPLMDGSASSSSPGLLPTPASADARRGTSPDDRDRPESNGVTLPAAVSLLPTPTSRDGKGANQRGDDTCLHGALLPTPRATDGTKGGPNQRGSSGDLMLPSAVTQLLPTPVVSDSFGGRNRTSSRQDGSQHHAGTTLTDWAWEHEGYDPGEGA